MSDPSPGAPLPRGTSAIDVAKQGTIAAIKAVLKRYRSEGRYNQMRIWVVAAFLLDAVVTGLVVTSAGGNSFKLEAWYQRGFPSNLVVVRNLGSELEEADLELDGRYKVHADKITIGANGFSIDQQFLDASQLAPPADYQPQKLVVRIGRSKVELPIGPLGAAH